MQAVGVLKSCKSVSLSGRSVSHKRLVQEATEARGSSNNNNKDSILFSKVTFQTCTKQTFK
jgi:hypothetical protein